jgi:hypothetical protein
MNSDSDTACAVGCPIRKSRDQRLLASPPGLSQRATSFIASQCQGIHQMPFITRLSTAPNGKDQTASLQTLPAENAANFSLEDTCRTRQPPVLRAFRRGDRYAGRALLGHVTYSLLHPVNQQNATEVSSLQPRIGTSCRVVLVAPSPSFLHHRMVVEVNGIEPMTSCLQSRRSPN